MAHRLQIPLKLSYSMTIHKSQGLSLDYVEVNCSNIFVPGQLGVAIGQAKTTSGLAVYNVDERKHIIPASTDVTEFMSTPFPMPVTIHVVDISLVLKIYPLSHAPLRITLRMKES